MKARLFAAVAVIVGCLVTNETAALAGNAWT